MENRSTNNPVDFNPSNFIAALWSMMLPGLGQLLKGRIMSGVSWAIVVGGGYFSYFWPGLVLHGLCIMDAAFTGLKTWPQRLFLLGVVLSLLFYIVYRNF